MWWMSYVEYCKSRSWYVWCSIRTIHDACKRCENFLTAHSHTYSIYIYVGLYELNSNSKDSLARFFCFHLPRLLVFSMFFFSFIHLISFSRSFKNFVLYYLEQKNISHFPTLQITDRERTKKQNFMCTHECTQFFLKCCWAISFAQLWKGDKLKVKFQQSTATAVSLLMHVHQNEPNGIQNHAVKQNGEEEWSMARVWEKKAPATTTDLPKIKTVGVNYVIQINNNGCECMSCG